MKIGMSGINEVSPRARRGMTLIELMIVVAVAAVLIAVAIPSYTNHVVKSQRADARSTLLELALIMERCYSQHNRFDRGICSNLAFPRESTDGHYQITSSIGAETFVLEARPVGRQAERDAARCSSFQVDHLGRKDATGDDEDRCW